MKKIIYLVLFFSYFLILANSQTTIHEAEFKLNLDRLTQNDVNDLDNEKNLETNHSIDVELNKAPSKSITFFNSSTISVVNKKPNETLYSLNAKEVAIVANYCSSNGNSTNDEYISRVQLNTIDNSSGTGTTSTGYSDFTAISTSLNTNVSYTITINPTWTGSTYNEGYSVWIDYNQDGDFTDAGEQVFTQSPTTATSISGSFTIPLSATVGNTRMRVSMKYNNIPTSCESFSYGEVEDYTINIVASTPTPEINITGLGNNITDGDTTPSVSDDTNFGSVSSGTSVDHTFTIENLGDISTTLSLTGAPIVNISGSSDFTILTQPSSSSIVGGNTLTFVVRYSPLANGTVTATISIANDDSDENPYNFTIQGTGAAPLTAGPGGITTDLQLWLKANDGLGYSDGQSVSLWADQGRGSDATVNTAGQEPTYRDNAAYNVNFNPVVDFDNSYNPVAIDGDFSYDNTSTQFLEGTSGLYTQDMFVVLIPDTTIDATFGSMDVFCGDENMSSNQTDATGIGLGAYTVRFSGEILCYALGTTSSGNGYGVAEIGTGNTYSNVGIINARNNAAATQQELYYNANDIETTQNDVPDFSNVNNSRYWIGRSEGWEASTDARIAEIITFSSRQDNTTERTKIESYLAIKYGITLGINGTSQDYVDSSGSIIWDVSANSGFNYDIAGIGQDNSSELLQKQSKSVNSSSIVTIGLGEIAATNNLNSNSFVTDKDFLVWGNNNANFNTSLESVQSINLSSSTTTFTRVSKKWKIIESQNDVPEVVISIPTSTLTSNIPLAANEEYMLVVSDNASFGSINIIDIVPLTTNGSNSEVWYDFDGTKYFTIAKATRVEEKRSVDFLAGEFLLGDKNVELNSSSFTVSAWVQNNINGGSFISKGTGYNFKINGSKKVEIDWNGTTKITSTNTIDSKWHHIALTFNAGTATLYIDGILDKTVNSLTNPSGSNYKFTIGALYTNKNTITSFDGAVDEVRIWDTNLSVDEIRYIMNQEIIEHSDNTVDGEILPQSITKNDIKNQNWANLKAYYDMNSFYGTTVEDNSNNKNWARIKYLIKDKQLVENQTAPLPYKSIANGDWNTAATWLNNSVQYLPNSTVNGTQVDWNIVETYHNITSGDRDIIVLGLISDTGTLTIADSLTPMDETNDGQSLKITHYLELDGSIDLVGESQFIQDQNCILDQDSGGFIERDQQGTASSFNYNYWSSSVGPITAGIGTKGTGIASTNANYTISGILNDGTVSSSLQTINFQGSYAAADGAVTSPITISSYWFWKFNGTDDDYNSWVAFNESSSLIPGEGFTMKGTSGIAAITDNQNYVFKGKPNNGDITLSIALGNDRLIGNPYPSAIDANEFILDNISDSGGRAATNIINGALYFWHHFSGATHVLGDYVGGYATYTLLGGVQAYSNDVRINNNGSAGGKIPERYIPVNQGFFVVAELDGSVANTTSTVTGGTITFKNSQRVFKREASASGLGSVFFKTNPKQKKQSIHSKKLDTRPKIRLQFDSPSGYHRQLLVGVDLNASNHFDIGYDAPLIENNTADIFWIFNESKFTIQAVNNFNLDQELPLGLKVEKEGLVTIKIDTLENISDEIEIFLKDKELNKFYDIKNKEYQTTLLAGAYNEKYSLTFKKSKSSSLSNDILNKDLLVFYNKENETINIKNLQLIKINTIALFNTLGQNINVWNSNLAEENLSFKANVKPGVYLLQVLTEKGKTTKKLIMN